MRIDPVTGTRRLPAPVENGTARWSRLLQACAPALWLGTLLVLGARWGLGASEAARAVVTVVATQVLPGTIIWRVARPAERGWWIEDVSMGFALGVVLAIATQAVAGWLGLPLLALATGPILGIGLLASPRVRRRVVKASTTPLSACWWSATTLAVVPLAIRAEAFFRTNPVHWESGFTAPYLDMPFHLALVSELAHRGPSQIPYVLGEPLRYHWFSHAWAAQVGVGGDIPLDVVLYRLMPAVVSVAAIAIVAASAIRMADHEWAGPIAAVLVVLAGDIDLLSGAVPSGLIDHRSPSLGLSNILLVGLLCLLTLRWRPGSRSPWTVGLLVALAVGTAGTKGSALPVVIAGVSLALLVTVAGRWPQRHIVALDLAILTGLMSVAFLTLFGGATGQLRMDAAAAVASANTTAAILLDSSGTGAGIVAVGVALVLLDGLGRGGGLLAVPASPSLRRDPVIYMLLGIGLAGTAAVALFSHPGGSQNFFLRNAAPALALGSAVGLVTAWQSTGAVGRRRLVGALGVGVSVAAVLAWLPWPRTVVPTLVVGVCIAGLLLVLGWRMPPLPSGRAGGLAFVGTVLCVLAVLPAGVHRATSNIPDPAPIRAHDARGAFSAGQVEAARWLRDHSGRNDVVATNRHCGSLQFSRCDSRRFYVAAYTERRVLVEGWSYTQSWVNSPSVEGVGDVYKPFWDPDRLALNDKFFASPTTDRARALWDLGVRWLYVDRAAGSPEGLEAVADVRYETQWSRVLELRPPPDGQSVANMSQDSGVPRG